MSLNARRVSILQKAVDHQTIKCTDVDLAIGYGRDGKMAGRKAVAGGVLVAFVQLLRQVGGVVGVEDSSGKIGRDRPYYAVSRAVGRD